jgi:hypothetical protein
MDGLEIGFSFMVEASDTSSPVLIFFWEGEGLNKRTLQKCTPQPRFSSCLMWIYFSPKVHLEELAEMPRILGKIEIHVQDFIILLTVRVKTVVV